MRRNHACRIIALAAASLLAATAAQADIIDYSATGVIEQVDNSFMPPGGLFSALIGQSFTFDFSIDTSTPGSGSPGDATYFSAVQSSGYQVGGYSSPFGMSINAVEILNNSGGFTGYIMSGGDPVSGDFTGTAGAVSFVTLAYSEAPLSLYSDTTLFNAPLSAEHANIEDDLAVSYTAYVNGAAQSVADVLVGPLSIKRSGDTLSAPEIDPASAAGGLTLFLGMMLVLGTRRKPGAAVE